MSRKVTIYSAFVLICLMAILVFSKLFTVKYKIPNVTGTAINKAERLLEESGIPDDKIIYSYTYSDTAAKDTVIHQRPAAGRTISGNNHLILTVSQGEDPNARITLQDFTGMKREEIEQWFNENGFTDYDFQDEIRDELEEGVFLASNPSAGTRVTTNQKIQISLAAHSAIIKYPDFTGQKTEDIQKWASLYDIEANIIYYYDQSPADTFLFSDLEPGTEIERGSSVSIAVSAGPGE